jgi:hypothetical protein
MGGSIEEVRRCGIGLNAKYAPSKINGAFAAGL